tara:strand:+ start:808 stop:1050 length:243 start_codon:yes stop_codon:yes gene_type:complete
MKTEKKPLTLEQVLERKLTLKIYDYKQLSDKEKIEMFERELIDSEESIIYLEKRREYLFSTKMILEDKLFTIKRLLTEIT